MERSRAGTSTPDCERGLGCGRVDGGPASHLCGGLRSPVVPSARAVRRSPALSVYPPLCPRLPRACRDAGSQPELGTNRVSLRPPICPKGGPIDLLGIPGPNSAQKSGGKGWNPANGVPFCARAYICRPRPLGLAGWLCDAGEYVGPP